MDPLGHRKGSPTTPTVVPPGTPRVLRGPPLILLPTLNEEAGLRITLEDLESVGEFPNNRIPDVLVVDGRSTDRTREVARDHLTRLILQRGRGKGAAVREGLDWAVQNGYGSVAVLDADGTYPCDRLPAMIGLLENEADVVAGVRRPLERPNATGRVLVHRIGNGLLNFCAAQLSGGPIMDVCSGFWGVRVATLPLLDLQSTGFEVESELFVKSMRRGLRVVQIPVEYRPRVGEAKLRAVRDGSRILLSILRHSATTPGPAGSRPEPGLPRPGSRRGPTPPLARDLTTFLCTLQASSVLFLSGVTRYPEAVEVARTVERRRPDVQVSTRIVPPGGERGVSPPDPTSSGRDGPSPDVVVTFPDATGKPTDHDSALVSVPRVGRTLILEDRGPVGDRIRHQRARHSPFGLGRGIPRPSPLVILGAMLDASGFQKEVALAAANASGGHLWVSRFRPRAGRRDAPPGSWPPGFPSRPASSPPAGSN